MGKQAKGRTKQAKGRTKNSAPFSAPFFNPLILLLISSYFF